jgi:translation initiation factor eIF-2B subunit delta
MKVSMEVEDMDNEMCENIKQVKGDREHGSTWIISKTLEILKKAPSTDRTRIAEDISSAHPEMSGLRKIVECLAEGADIYDLIWMFEEANRRTSQSLSEVLEDMVVLTISRSHIVEEGLLNARKVYVLESLPGGEGKHLAQTLRRRGVDSETVPDLFISKLIGRCDIVVSGADAFSREGFVNKTGTMALAIVSNYFNKPFYVGTPLYKFSEKLSVQREIFEFVPFSLVSKIVFEEGAVEPSRLAVEPSNRFIKS